MPEGHAFALGGADADAHDMSQAPIIVALPPRVAPNIMAMKTGAVFPGQLVKPAASATSGTASALTPALGWVNLVGKDGSV
jgi:hypothetical protein